MATYDELLAIASTTSGTALRNRIRVAVVVAADVIRAEAPATVNHANRLAWARLVLDNPDRQAERMLWAVLAQNRAATVAQITAADDATVQTAVNAAVDLLAGVA
jgi:hypothetical protein